MGEALQADNIQAYKKAFLEFDKSGKGIVLKADLRHVLQCIGIQASDEDVKRVMANNSFSDQSYFDFNQFLTVIRSLLYYKDEEKEWVATFNQFDADGSGFITKNEMKRALDELGLNLAEDEVDEMIRQADSNGDGTVDYQEFVRMMQHPEGL